MSASQHSLSCYDDVRALVPALAAVTAAMAC